MKKYIKLDEKLIKSYESFCNVWGSDLQVDVAIEEMAELTQELIKYRRKNGSNKAELVGELADVFVTALQLVYIYDCEEEVNEIFNSKVKRTIKRTNDMKNKVV